MDRTGELFEAIKGGDRERVSALLAEEPSLANDRGAGDVAPALMALYAQEPEIADLLVAHGAVVDIWLAAARGDVARIEALLAEDAGLARALSPDGWTPLHLAAYFGQSNAMRTLLARGAEVDARSGNEMRDTPLHAAGPLRQIGAMGLLLEHGAEVNTQQQGGWTALHEAALLGDSVMATLLLSHGAMDLPNDAGTTALALAEEHGQMGVAELLRRHEASAQSTPATPHEEATMTTPATSGEPTQEIIDEFVGNAHGDLAHVQALLTHYPAIVNASASWKETAIEAAAQMAREDIATVLLTAGAPLDICTAAVLGRLDVVAALLEADPAQAHATGAHGIPVLYFPVIGNHRVIAELLLERGAELNAGAGGTTPLHGAAMFGRREMAAWLLASGADANARNYENHTPLRVALDREHGEVAEVLRAHGGMEE